MGGTNIYEPLHSAFYKLISQLNYHKKIFLLTDGEVEQPEKVIKLV